MSRKSAETQVFDAKRCFISRELTWLEFNHRVLMEADNPENPLFERMKFLSIVSSNLDEFFMVRVASLRNKVNAGIKTRDIAGLTPRQQLEALLPRVRAMVTEQSEIYRKKTIPQLRRAGLRLSSYQRLTPEVKGFLSDYFQQEIYPLLTPVAVDATRRFPLVQNKMLNLGVLLADKHEKGQSFLTVQIPNGVPRVILLPQELLSGGDRAQGVMVEQVVAAHIGALFPGRKVLCAYPYRVTRGSDFPIDEEDESEDLLTKMEKSIKKRKWGDVVRLQVAHNMRPEMLALIRKGLKAAQEDVLPIHGPLDLVFLLKQLYGLQGFEKYRYAPFKPAMPEGMRNGRKDLFEAIREKDILLHHPYDSFEPVTRFIRDAAADPDVLSIKMTLYRVSGQSPIIRSLGDAAQAGKQVTVLLEVKARFDEENNMRWGRELERKGCLVLYGVKGLKTHAKIALVIRREPDGLRRYVHLGTGNYNDITAGLYTDMGVLTAAPDIGRDASRFFNHLTGYGEDSPMDVLVSAPEYLRGRVLDWIEREAEHARAGRRSGITVKMNSLIDQQVIAALYRASQAGVPVRLLVRGICSLRPGLPGISETIEVRSIVGRLLEHSRIFIFENGGDREVYLSSADWMGRNLDRRVELMFPIRDDTARKRVEQAMDCCWRDNCKAWIQETDGSYVRAEPSEPPVNAQETLIACRQEPLADATGSGLE